MNLNFETILDFYTHKNRKILCQIKVTTPPSTNHKFNNTCCRALSQKQWKTFDKELEKLITTTNDDWNEARCLKFNINPCIEVKVQKSKLSLKHFYKCLGAIEDYVKDIDQVAGDGKEDNYVLECLINFQKEDPLNTPSLESQEYEPQINTTPDKLSSPLSYEPYTPSKKKYRADNIDTIKTPGIDLLESNEDTYSPKPIFPCASGEELIMETIPKYTPAPIKNTHGSKDNMKSLQHDLIDKIIVETGEEIKSLKSKLRNKKSKKAQCEYIPKSQEFAVVDVPVYIPTPIGETTIRKDFKSDYDFKKHRKRSKTIDEFPGLLLNENTNENYKTISECVNRNDKHGYHYDNKKFKKRSRTIDEIPAGFAVNIEKIKNLPEVSKSKEKKTTFRQNIYKTTEKITKLEKISENTLTVTVPSEVEMSVYIPTPIDENSMSSKVITTDYHSRKHKKRSNTIDELPGQLPIEIDKDKYKNNNEYIKSSDKHSIYSSNHSKAIDEIPNGLDENNENLLSKKSPEENKGKLSKKLESPDKTTPVKLKESKCDLNKTSPPTAKQKEKKSSERIKIIASPPAKDLGLTTTPNKKSKKSSKIPAEENSDKFEYGHNTSTSNLNNSTITAIETTIDTTPPQQVFKRERKQHEKSTIDINKSLRRSERPPSKPVGLIEEQDNLLKSNKSKKLKTSPKNKELFGTDDEDDDDHFKSNT